MRLVRLSYAARLRSLMEATLILVGQYDSPFFRRVAIGLRPYGLAYEHRPWSVFADGEKIEPYNPLRRVPTLILDDAEVLIESAAILDYQDELVGPTKALIHHERPKRRVNVKVRRFGWTNAVH
jgi:glutathione S-transferase